MHISGAIIFNLIRYNWRDILLQNEYFKYILQVILDISEILNSILV